MDLPETPTSPPVPSDPAPSVIESAPASVSPSLDSPPSQSPAALVAPTLPPTAPASHAPVRRYGFLCSYCSSRLEAHDALAGQSGNCPTCGNSIVIPILDRRGRLIDPTTGQIIKQDPLPVHAYAAAGTRAPRIVNVNPASAAGAGMPNTGDVPMAPGPVPPRREDDPRPTQVIECPRCLRRSQLHANHCSGCGLPFTMEGTNSPLMGSSNGWAVASLILGIVGLTGGFIIFAIPCLLSLIFGVIAIRRTQGDPNVRGGMVLAVAGFILGLLGTLLAILLFARIFM